VFAAAPIGGGLQAHLAVACVADQPPAPLPVSLLVQTSLDSLLCGCAETVVSMSDRVSLSRAKSLALAGCQQRPASVKDDKRE